MSKPLMPWVVISTQGVYWLGMAKHEDHAWQMALGWPDQPEIDFHKQLGWYAAEAMLTWQRPVS